MVLELWSEFIYPFNFFFLSGIGLTLFFPALLGYLTVTKQENAAAVASCIQFLQFSMAGIGVGAGVAIAAAIGVGPLCTIVGGIAIPAILFDIWFVNRKIKQNSL